MAAKQTSMLLGRLVEHQAHFDPLSTYDAQWAIENPKFAAALCVEAIKRRSAGKVFMVGDRESVLCADKRIFSVSKVFHGPFVASKEFFGGSRDVLGRSPNFSRWFFDKVEDVVPTRDLLSFVTVDKVYERDMLEDPDDCERFEVILGEIWRVICDQQNGEDGILSKGPSPNIFFARDAANILRTIVVSFHEEHKWLVAAYEFGQWWPGGYYFFIPNI